jgi:hypothetical protein
MALGWPPPPSQHTSRQQRDTGSATGHDPALAVENAYHLAFRERLAVFRRDNQHGAWRDLEQPMRDAPKQQTLQRSTAHAAQNNQVGCGCRRGVSDRVSGAAECDLMDLEVDMETRRFQGRDLLADPRLDLRLESLNVVGTAMTWHQFIHMDHQQPSLLIDGELLCVSQGEIACPRTIGREQDCLEHVSTSLSTRGRHLALTERIGAPTAVCERSAGNGATTISAAQIRRTLLVTTANTSRSRDTHEGRCR